MTKPIIHTNCLKVDTKVKKTVEYIANHVLFHAGVVAGIAFFSFSSTLYAACDCGSTDQQNPCTGNSISVVVNASTVNGNNSTDATFNWSFNSGGEAARCGQFANGDYWIAPAAGQTSVSINAITGSDSITADDDPIMEAMGLLNGSKNYGNHDSSENIISNLPISYSNITSLVAAIQRDESATGNCGTPGITGECADAYNVITVLQNVPANAGSDMIRPNITGETKEMLTLADFDFSRLPAKSFLNGTDTAEYEAIRQRWSHSTEIFGVRHSVDGVYSEGGRAFRSHILIDDYAAGVARQWYNDLMYIFSDDDSLTEKQSALAAMLTYGLDLYHAIYDPPPGTIRYWGTGAGQHHGRFMPPVLMAALSINSIYADNLKTTASNVHLIRGYGPNELAQVHPGVNGPVWGDDSQFSGSYIEGGYWSELNSSKCYDGAPGTCDTSIGKKTQKDEYGYIDGPPNKPGQSYMAVSMGPQRSMAAVMLLMPEICEIINYNDLVTYVQRVDNDGVLTANDLCVTPDSREATNCDPYRDQNCTYFKVTWGPDPNNPGDCIKTATPPYTKVGRFTNLHGNAVSYGYTSTQVESNWATLMGENEACSASSIIQPPSDNGIARPTPFRRILPIKFNEYTFTPYDTQGGTGPVTVEDNYTLSIDGNNWVQSDQGQEITLQTVLEFDFMSTIEGEIHGIGFDEDSNLANSLRIFQLFGSQTFNGVIPVTPKYTSNDLGQWLHFKIPIGQYYTGSSMYLVFVNDHDNAPADGNSRFKNVTIEVQ